MDLPLSPPVQPMLAKSADAVPPQPAGDDPVWSYEPKWDGFRALVFRDRDEVVLSSRSGKDLARYFPEMVDAIRGELPDRCVLDGELVVPREVDGRTRLDWEALSERIHPAASRVALLAEQTPAQLIGFDLLALGDTDLTGRPFEDRRAALLDVTGGGPSCHVTRATTDPTVATEWFHTFEGAGLDGVIAKRLSGAYVPNKREMVKVKHARTADVVVIGYRPHKSQPGIGSMLLGLYDGDDLRFIGGASAFTATRRVELQEILDPLRLGDDVVHDGETSRWAAGKDRQWVPIRPELVVEVAYDQLEGDRLRHVARFLRWRPDREPRSCTYEQLDVPVRYDLADVLAGGK
ncbi:ATP-dependent DNA ligase [Rhodococcus sp. NPDC054953]